MRLDGAHFKKEVKVKKYIFLPLIFDYPPPPFCLRGLLFTRKPNLHHQVSGEWRRDCAQRYLTQNFWKFRVSIGFFFFFCRLLLLLLSNPGSFWDFFSTSESRETIKQVSACKMRVSTVVGTTAALLLLLLLLSPAQVGTSTAASRQSRLWLSLTALFFAVFFFSQL